MVLHEKAGSSLFSLRTGCEGKFRQNMLPVQQDTQIACSNSYLPQPLANTGHTVQAWHRSHTRTTCVLQVAPEPRVGHQ